jgi:hypothetical protein
MMRKKTLQSAQYAQMQTLGFSRTPVLEGCLLDGQPGKEFTPIKLPGQRRVRGRPRAQPLFQGRHIDIHPLRCKAQSRPDGLDQGGGFIRGRVPVVVPVRWGRRRKSSCISTTAADPFAVGERTLMPPSHAVGALATPLRRAGTDTEPQQPDSTTAVCRNPLVTFAA